MMDTEVESYIKSNIRWEKLPKTVKEYLGMNPKTYDRAVIEFSVRNQLRHKGSLVGKIRRDPEQYYTELLEFSKENLMLYPYHLQDMLVKGLRITPFQYYVGMVQRIVQQEKNYDCLPNFTAADCLRLLGLGRNEYIDLMTECRTGRRMFKRMKSVREHLPSLPIDIRIDPWWIVQLGYLTQDDLKQVNTEERALINSLMNAEGKQAKTLHFASVHSLYSKGLIYLDVPVSPSDAVFVPPLEGFVMNRLMGDYFETLLYKIFVSIDGLTTVGELSGILNIEPQQVEHAVSMFYRLGFVQKTGSAYQLSEDDLTPCHPSWLQDYRPPSNRASTSPDAKKVIEADDQLLEEISAALADEPQTEGVAMDGLASLPLSESNSTLASAARAKRTALLFDSTLTAILMMGNLCGGLKSHAVTMFEVGKLTDESLDAFLSELDTISSVGEEEGEAERFFSFALNLREALKFLRGASPLGTQQIDLIRIESLQTLDPEITIKLLAKNYSLLLSLAPLSCETLLPLPPSTVPHLGPPLTEANSVWMKLLIYHLTGSGPPTLLLPQGARLRALPRALARYPCLQLCLGNHDPVVIQTSHALNHLNESCLHATACVQGWLPGNIQTRYLAFPLQVVTTSGCVERIAQDLQDHLGLQHTCGYLTFVNLCRHAKDKRSSMLRKSSPTVRVIEDPEKTDLLSKELELLAESAEEQWVLSDCSFGLPLMDKELSSQVCDSIVEKGLGKVEHLETLMATNEGLSSRLKEFIRRWTEEEGGKEKVLIPDFIKKKLPLGSLPPPTQPLLFTEGQLRVWSERRDM